jgi:fibronectin type 3 domain-containing protein
MNQMAAQRLPLLRSVIVGTIRSNRSSLRFEFKVLAIVVLSLLGNAALGQAQISYVQGSYAVPQTPQSSVIVAFPGAQTVGSFNLVAIGWNDATSQVGSVTDARGNVYTAASAPTVQTGIQSHVIYYAANIVAAPSNSITVTFNTAVAYPDVRIAEYRGIAQVTPVDGAQGASGTGNSASTGTLTTTVANALLVGATYVQTTTTGAGTGFTARMITSPNGSILEDRIVSAVGTYSATAPTSGQGWVIQLVAFRGVTTGPADTQAPTAPGTPSATVISGSRIDLTWPAATDNVGVTAYLVERCAGAGCSNFAQVASVTMSSYSNTGLATSTSYSFRIRATDAAGNQGPYSPQATATTSAVSDTQPPSAPTGVSAAVVSGSQVNLTWVASTDNVAVQGYQIERCQGSACTNFVQIGTSVTTSYNDSSLTVPATYRYRVRAIDAAGNASAYSSIVSATTPDTQAPSAPPTISATTMSANRINVAWTAATDNVAVTGYRVERCQGVNCTNFAQVTTTTTALSYNNTGLSTGTSYSYRVRATDAAGNLGSYSAVATAITSDGQAPTAPANLSSTAVSSSEIDLTWTASTDNVAVTGYRVERCVGSGCTNFVEVGTSVTTAFASTGLAPSTTYRHRVRATDLAGNFSSYSTVVTATTTAGPDTQPPTAPGNPSASPVSISQINLGWGASTDNVAVSLYLVERCQGSACTDFTEVGSSSTTVYASTGLASSTTYRFRIRARDAAGNLSPYSAAIAATTLGAPSLSITQPAQGASVVGSVVAVGYTVSGDQTEVNHVHFQLDGGPVLMDLTLDGSYQLSNVAPGSHVLTGVLVRADHTPIPGTDATPVNFTTVPDTQPPTAPGAPSASAVSSSQISLTWTAATDDAGVVGYRVERCQSTGCTDFAEVAIATGLGFADSGLAASTTYRYRVRAADAASNLGPYSQIVSAATQSAAPPVPISYVQGAYAVPQTPQSSVIVAFPGAQTVGSLNVVGIGWNDATSQVISVTDTWGNLYTQALAPTVQAGARSHVIYYAKNIVAAPSNSITVTFSTAVSYPDLRIAEYRGIDPLTPVDGGKGAFGTGTTANSGTLTTTVANALLVGATYVETITTGAGTGFTARMITAPDGSLLEDRIVSAVGAYSASATTSGQGWVIQLVAFRGATSGSPVDTQAPTAPGAPSASVISSSRIDLTWPPATDNVGVTGYLVERCTGPGCSNFAQVATSTSSSYSNTGLAASTSYSFRVRASDAAGNMSPYSQPTTATTLAPAPTSLSIYLPADGSSVSGNATFGAAVTGAIVGVQFQVDNVNVGPPIDPSVTLSVNTAQFANGSHVIRAYGWDAQRNVVSAAPITVSFSNTSPGNPAQTGLWSGVFSTPLVSINVTLMNNGRVLMYDRLNSGNPIPQVWDPLTNSFLPVPLNDGTNLFCSAQVVLPDGRVFVAGGHLTDDVGLPTGRIFDPATNLWSATPDMAVGRWYPTATVLPNGKVLVLSGEVGGRRDYARVPEVYDPVTNTWTSLPLASLALQFYPHVFVLPNGKVGVTGTAEVPTPARVLDVATQTWTTVESKQADGYSSAMYLPGKVLKTGTSTDSLSTNASSAKANVIDLMAANPQWRQVAPMANPRAYHVETLLPDGTVLVTGGGRTTGDYDIANAVYAAELWSPATETWTTLASMQTPRLYHGSALLLPDGRVLVSGGGRSPGPSALDQESLEIFAPPYLFKGPRPVIASAPSVLTYNQAFTVQTPDAARVSRVALMAVGNMTHGFNMSQRYLPLSYSATSNSLTVTAPPDSNTAPPGIYMLFIVDTKGVPSIASFVRF